MKTLFTALLVGFLVVPASSFAQNETNHWMFGHHAGLDFSSGAPVPESGCMLSTVAGGEMSASISDPITGNLLMYTGRGKVYTANHTLMPNGVGLFGYFTNTQSVLIVPKPGSTTLFYIFHPDSNFGTGYHYSIVDMTLNGGLGAVIAAQINVLIFNPGSALISATKHANCTDWWIMTKEKNNNVYRAYLLTAAGLSNPIISTVGMDTGSGATAAKFSPDGTKYANTASGGGSSSRVQLFDFDNATGLLSNPITLVDDFQDESSSGLSFSGDNSKLYVARGPLAEVLYQYDLSSGVPATIIASETFISNLGTWCFLQLAKDHKIYIANTYTSNISVINDPNALGIACGFSAISVPIAGSGANGICNFPDSFFDQSSPCVTAAIPEAAESTLQIANFVTPDGDGINDVFKIENLPQASSLDILNQWGSLVFTSDNYNNDWSGNSNGIYFYKLKTPDDKTYNGIVQVVVK